MKRGLMILGGAFWFALVFFITWRVTFPSQAAADRVSVEVDRASGGDFQLALSNVRPWWTGIAADNVILYEVSRGRGDAESEKSALFAFESAKVKAGIFSLLRNAPRVVGAV